MKPEWPAAGRAHTVFDKTTRDELIRRIHSLDEHATPRWGSMTIYQMVKHCRFWDEMALGKQKYKRTFLGKLFGRIALRGVLREGPLGKNTPTIPEFRIKELAGDVAAEKRIWIARIDEYAIFSNPDFVHPFFGNMTTDQIGLLAYKHADHHLRQFGS
jgi:hypothetical protein